MNTLGDDLAERIRGYVAAQVPPSQIEAVTKTVCLVVITLMRDPKFLNELLVIQELQQENYYLRNQLAIAQGALARYRPAKKATAKKAPARKKGVTKAQAKAFQQGVRDIRGS